MVDRADSRRTAGALRARGGLLRSNSGVLGVLGAANVRACNRFEQGGRGDLPCLAVRSSCDRTSRRTGQFDDSPLGPVKRLYGAPIEESARVMQASRRSE